MTSIKELYFGGGIFTVDDANPLAEAVAVKDGMILAVGSIEKCKAALGQGYASCDLQGGTMLPGFIDTHFHPLMKIYYDMNADLRGARSMEELQERLRKLAKPEEPDAWVMGLDFDENWMDVPKLPTRRDLDLACPNNPTIVIKHDGHMVIANTKAIQISHVTASTLNPDGGIIDREPDGFPAGPFREAASQLVKESIPLPSMDSLEEGAKFTFKNMAACGITSAGGIIQTSEEGPIGALGSFEVGILSALIEHSCVNLFGILLAKDHESVVSAKQTSLHQAEPGGHHIGAVKIYADGTFGSHTALMREPFSDLPDKKQLMTMSDTKELYRRMVFAHKAGLQIAIHSIGDASNRICVDLYEQLLNQFPRPVHRHRIEHASVLDYDTIADMKRLGIIVSVQPLFIHSEKHWLHKRLGFERAKITYPFRSLAEAGVKVAGASDAPIESIDVLHAIQCCVTREGFEPQQGISAEQAIRMYTTNAAYAQFEEEVKGSITPGKRADLVVLDQNPLKVSPDLIGKIQVLKTIRKGKVTYQRM